jgi:hypothetical protein
MEKAHGGLISTVGFGVSRKRSKSQKRDLTV